MKRLIVGIIILSLLTSCDSYHKNLKGTNFNVGWINLAGYHTPCTMEKIRSANLGAIHLEKGLPRT